MQTKLPEQKDPRQDPNAIKTYNDYTKWSDWVSKGVEDSATFGDDLKRGITKDLGGFQDLEKRRWKSLTDAKEVYNTDSADLVNIKDPATRQAILKQRGSDKLSDYLTFGNVLTNVKGTVDNIVDSGVKAFLGKIEGARTKADTAYRSWRDIIGDQQTQNINDTERFLQQFNIDTNERDWNYKLQQDALDRTEKNSTTTGGDLFGEGEKSITQIIEERLKNKAKGTDSNQPIQYTPNEVKQGYQQLVNENRKAGKSSVSDLIDMANRVKQGQIIIK